MVRWLRIGVGLAVLVLSVAGCAVVPLGMTASPAIDDITRELHAVRRDLGTLKRAQARHAVTIRRSRSDKLSQAVTRLDRLSDRLEKQAVEQTVSTNAVNRHAELVSEIAQLRVDVGRLQKEMRAWQAAQAGNISATSKTDAERQHLRQQQDKMLAAMAQLTEAVDRNNAQLTALAGRIADADQKVSALQLQLTSRPPDKPGGGPPSKVPQAEKPQGKGPQGSQAVTNALGSADKLCASECAAGSATSPGCHRCASCAEQCVRREGASPAALNACRSYCGTR